MVKFAKSMCAVLLILFYIGIPLCCQAQEGPVDVGPEELAVLMKDARQQVEKGDRVAVEMALDLAFDMANTIGDYETLMEIGDLYLRVDKSLKDKAMAAWTAAGRCKNRR